MHLWRDGLEVRRAGRSHSPRNKDIKGFAFSLWRRAFVRGFCRMLPPRSKVNHIDRKEHESCFYNEFFVWRFTILY